MSVLMSVLKQDAKEHTDLIQRE